MTRELLGFITEEIDEDFRSLKSSSSPRDMIYYHIDIDKRRTSVVARKDNRTSYIINTPTPTISRTPLYLEDWHIGLILSRLDTRSFEAIRSWLVGSYSKRAHTVHKLTFTREAMRPSFTECTFSASVTLLYPENIEDFCENIDTPFGFHITSLSFLDFIALTLSMESGDKLKTSLLKYCLIAELVREQKNKSLIKTLPELKHISTTKDIELLYKNSNMKQIAEHDKKLFTKELAARYFDTLTT